MSKPFKLIVIRDNVCSLHFPEGHHYDLPQLAAFVADLFLGIKEVTNTFNRINLFTHTGISLQTLNQELDKINFSSFVSLPPTKIWELPICFDASFSTDLEYVFQDDKTKIVHYRKTFLKTIFTLEFYGFLPGFGYLSGLPKALHLDRKKHPDRQLTKGAVAVGGEQVGVYPQESPGGWQCIGHSPVQWIDFKKAPHFFIHPGDGVRFVEIDLKRHKEITLAVEMNVYQPNNITL